MKSEDLRVRVAPHLRDKLKAIAAELGESEAAIIRSAVIAYIFRHEPLPSHITEIGYFDKPASLAAETRHEPGKVIDPAAAGGAGSVQNMKYPPAKAQRSSR